MDGDGVDDVIIGLALGKDVTSMLTEESMGEFCRKNGTRILILKMVHRVALCMYRYTNQESLLKCVDLPTVLPAESDSDVVFVCGVIRVF